MKFLDGSVLEGGGQILRNAVALSCLLHKPLTIESIRAGREKPGLKNQHLTGINLVGQICDARVSGCQLDSPKVVFEPGHPVPKREYEAKISTAGGITLLGQISIPCLVFCENPGSVITVDCVGGTNASFAPQIEYFENVTLPNLRKFGINARCQVMKRGYFPKGGGLVKFHITPLESGKTLNPISMLDPGEVEELFIFSYCSGVLPPTVAKRMAKGAQEVLNTNVKVTVDARKLDPEEAFGNGSNIVVVAKTDSGCILAADEIGKKGVKAEEVGRKAGEKLRNFINAKICVDEYQQDQLIIFMALASGTSFIVCGPLTLHTKTAIHVISEMTEAKFEVRELSGGSNVIKCEGIGLKSF